MQDQASPCPMKKLPGMLRRYEGQHYSRSVLNASNMVLLLVRICLDQISDKIFNLQVICCQLEPQLGPPVETV